MIKGIKIAYIIKRVLLIMQGLMLFTACVMAPSINERPEINQFPQIDYDKIQPLPDSTVTVTEAGVTFSTTDSVSDPDGDTISYYWYFYKQNQEVPIPLGNTSKLTFNPCKPFKYTNGTFGMLELIISDRQIKAEPETLYDFPDEAGVVSISWFVSIQMVVECN